MVYKLRIAFNPGLTAMTDSNVAKALSSGADAIYLKNRPLPEAPTGYYDWQATTDSSDDRGGHSDITNLVDRVSSLR